MFIVIYLLAIVLANLSVSYFGPVSLPFNAFLLIGLDLSLRDKLHESWKRDHLIVKMGALIAAGGLITFALNASAGRIAIASCVAFGVAAIVDTIVYQLLGREEFLIKANGSNVVSAAVDSILFPTLAFGVFMPLPILGQFIAKVFGGSLWAFLIHRYRTVVVAGMLLMCFNSAQSQMLITSAHYDIGRQIPTESIVYASPVYHKLFLNGFFEAWRNPAGHGFPQGWVWWSKHWLSYPLTKKLSLSTEIELGYNFPGSWSRWPDVVGFVPDKPQTALKIGFQYRIL